MKIDVILDPDSSPDEVRELGLLAETYGLQSVWTSLGFPLFRFKPWRRRMCVVFIINRGSYDRAVDDSFHCIFRMDDGR